MYEDYTDQLDEVYNQRVRHKEINGRKYTIRCSDPYGFWTLDSTNDGVKKPQELSDIQWTSERDAWLAIEIYDKAHSKELDARLEKKLKKTKPNLEI